MSSLPLFLWVTCALPCAHLLYAQSPLSSLSPLPQLAPQVGHTGRINTLAISPDGSLIASGSSDGTIKLWQARTGRLARTLYESRKEVHSVAFSPDGRTLASGSGDGAVKLWRVQDGKLMQTLRSNQGSVLSLAFSPDGELLASAGGESIILWSLHAAVDINKSDFFWRLYRYQASRVFFWPDNATVVDAGLRYPALIDIHTEEDLHPPWIAEHDVAPDALAFSPDRKTVAARGLRAALPLKEAVFLYDSQNRRETGVLTGHTAAVRSAVFSSDGRLIATAGEDRTAKLWDCHTSQCLRTLSAGDVFAIGFSPDGRTLATGDADATIKLWDVETGTLRKSLVSSEEMMWSFALSPDGRMLACARRPIAMISSQRSAGLVWLWDLQTAVLRATLRLQSDAVSSLAFSPDGTTLACAGREVTLWDRRATRRERTLSGIESPVGCIAFSPDGKQLATGGCEPVPVRGDMQSARASEGEVKLWNPKAGGLLHALEGHGFPVLSIAFSPDGKTLASAGGDAQASDDIPGEVKVWNVQTGRLLKTLTGHGQEVVCLAYSPDGKTLATGGGDATVQLWDPLTGEIKRTLVDHTDAITCLAFAPAQKRATVPILASGSLDTTVRLWNANTGELLRTITSEGGGVSSLLFLPDGRRLVIGNADGTITLWDSVSGRLLLTLFVMPSKGEGGKSVETKWLAVTPEGYYHCSPGADLLILARFRGNELVPFSHFASRYHRPDIVRRASTLERAR